MSVTQRRSGIHREVMKRRFQKCNKIKNDRPRQLCPFSQVLSHIDRGDKIRGFSFVHCGEDLIQCRFLGVSVKRDSTVLDVFWS